MAQASQPRGGLGRIVQARPGEGRALALSFGYFFFLLACYYVLRPVRDEMGVRSGVRTLPWLFTATFVVNLLIAPLYAGLVARLRRGVFIPVIYGFLVLNILGFWISLNTGFQASATAITFFVWITVFSVFAVSIFWSFMADLFTSEQAKRLYPTIAAGGSIGGVAGGAVVTTLATVVGAANLLLIAGALLIAALACAMGLERLAAGGAGSARPKASREAGEKLGGGWLAGLRTIFASPFLGGISVWVFLLSLCGTLAYYIQADVVGAAELSSDERTQLFGLIDMSANIAIPLIQLTIGRWALQKLGTAITLGIVSAVFFIGFLVLAAKPVLAVLVVLMAAQRAGQFALSNPARESLFTVVSREDKYKAKNVIDNAVFRGGDVANSWIYNLLSAGLGLGVSGVALVGTPVAAVWLVLSLWLGRDHSRRARDQAEAASAPLSESPKPAGA